MKLFPKRTMSALWRWLGLADTFVGRPMVWTPPRPDWMPQPAPAVARGVRTEQGFDPRSGRSRLGE